MQAFVSEGITLYLKAKELLESRNNRSVPVLSSVL